LKILFSVRKLIKIEELPSSGMLRRVALVRTNVSEERVASIIRVTGIGELGTLEVTSNRSDTFLQNVGS
jgi:hypothetical protein